MHTGEKPQEHANKMYSARSAWMKDVQRSGGMSIWRRTIPRTESGSTPTSIRPHDLTSRGYPQTHRPRISAPQKGNAQTARQKIGEAREAVHGRQGRDALGVPELTQEVKKEAAYFI